MTTLAGKAGTGGTTDGIGSAAHVQQSVGPRLRRRQASALRQRRITIIRSVDVTNGTVATIAGIAEHARQHRRPGGDRQALQSDEAWFSTVACSSSTNQDNGRLRQLDLGAKMVSTVASNLYAGSMATAGSGKLAFTNPVRVLDVATSALTTIMGADKQPIYDYGNTIVMQDDGSFWLGA